MKEKIKKYAGTTFRSIIMIAIVVAIISVIAIFGGVIMKLFGFEYESVGSIILFFLIVGTLSFPIEMLAKGLSNALLSLNKISISFARILFLVLDTTSTLIAMIIVDYFMDSVSATIISILIVAILMALICISDIKEKRIK